MVDVFSFTSGGTISDGHTKLENGKLEEEKIKVNETDDLLNIQFQPLRNGYNQYFFVRKVKTDDIEGNDVNLDTDEISCLNFSIILTDPTQISVLSQAEIIIADVWHIGKTEQIHKKHTIYFHSKWSWLNKLSLCEFTQFHQKVTFLPQSDFPFVDLYLISEKSIWKNQV